MISSKVPMGRMDFSKKHYEKFKATNRVKNNKLQVEVEPITFEEAMDLARSQRDLIEKVNEKRKI
jgi:hypothetical protein